MLTLLLSLAAIGVAPLLDRPLGRHAALASGADAFAAVAVLGTVLLHVLPHGVEQLGPLALLAAAAGLALPSICDLGGIRILGVAAVAGLGAHALVDGAMLAAPDEDAASHALSWAVVIHTVPLSLAIWRAARPHGSALAAALLGYAAICELLGWTGARALLDASGGLLGLLQCFTAGTMLHFVWAPAPLSRRGSGLGALLGGGAIVAMNTLWPLHRSYLEDLEVGPAMLGLALAMAPATALGLALAAPLRAASRARGPEATGAPGGGWDGTIALLATLAPLGAGVLALRALGATVLALALRRALPPVAAAAPDPRPLSARLASGLLPSLRALADESAGRLLLGLGLAAVLEALAPPSAVAALPPALALPTAALLGPLLGLGPLGVTPVAAVLLHKGLPIGAALAFLVAGSALQLDLLGRLVEAGGRRLAFRASALVMLIALATGWAAERLATRLPLPELHALAAGAGTPLAWAALGALAILGVDTVLRGGLPALMGPLARPHRHEPSHDHGHEHDHEH